MYTRTRRERWEKDREGQTSMRPHNATLILSTRDSYAKLQNAHRKAKPTASRLTAFDPDCLDIPEKFNESGRMYNSCFQRKRERERGSTCRPHYACAFIGKILLNPPLRTKTKICKIILEK